VGLPINSCHLSTGIGEDGRAASVAFFEDFEEVVASCGVERLETPIIEDEQLDTAEGSQDTSVTAISAREGEIGEELGNALVENGAIDCS
jgi:hypothetical protein